MSNLSPRVVEMIGMRTNGKTLEEIGAHFNLTRERVRQLLKNAGVDTTNVIYSLTCEYCRRPFKSPTRDRFCSVAHARYDANDRLKAKKRASGIQEQATSLSEREIEALLFIQRKRWKWGESPTYAEIAAWIGIKPNQASPMLAQLMRRGLLMRLKGERRAFYLTDRAVEILTEKGVYAG